MFQSGVERKRVLLLQIDAEFRKREEKTEKLIIHYDGDLFGLSIRYGQAVLNSVALPVNECKKTT